MPSPNLPEALTEITAFPIVEYAHGDFLNSATSLHSEFVLDFQVVRSSACQTDLEHAIELLFFRFDTFATRSAESISSGYAPCIRSRTAKTISIEERLFLAQQASVPDAAAENLAQHVAAAFVRWQNAVVDEESRGAGVVGDDAQAAADSSLGLKPALGQRLRPGSAAEYSARQFRRAFTISGVKQIGFEVATSPCSTRPRAPGPCRYRSKAWAAASACSRRLGRGVHKRRAVELHKDQVPDLDVARVVLAERLLDPGRSAASIPCRRNLRTRAAGAGFAHLPEVVLQAVLDDASLGTPASIQ